MLVRNRKCLHISHQFVPSASCKEGNLQACSMFPALDLWHSQGLLTPAIFAAVLGAISFF
jgi:hypothetical protein